MKEKDYYPEGSYNDPHAPWNEKESKLYEEEVEVLATANISTLITPCISEKFIDEDEDGMSEYYELVDNWKEIANNEFKTPDLIWKPITEQPKRNSWILVRKTNIHNFKREYEAEKYSNVFLFDNTEISLSENGFMYEWQYINEASYDIEIEDIEFQIP